MFLTILIIAVATTLAVEIVTILTPLVVLGATELVKKILPLVAGWVIVMIIVPALSLLITWLSSLAMDGLDFWAQAGIGLLAVFINQAYKQLKDIPK